MSEVAEQAGADPGGRAAAAAHPGWRRASPRWTGEGSSSPPKLLEPWCAPGCRARRSGPMPSRRCGRWRTGCRNSCSAAASFGPGHPLCRARPRPAIVSVGLHVGARLPAWCTSMGRVLLAGPASSRSWPASSRRWRMLAAHRGRRRTGGAGRRRSRLRGGRASRWWTRSWRSVRSIAVRARWRRTGGGGAERLDPVQLVSSPADMEREIVPPLRDAAGGSRTISRWSSRRYPAVAHSSTAAPTGPSSRSPRAEGPPAGRKTG